MTSKASLAQGIREIFMKVYFLGRRGTKLFDEGPNFEITKVLAGQRNSKK